MFPLRLRLLAIQSRALQSLRAQTHVDFMFCVGAIAEDFPHEAFGVAFVEEGDYFGAAFVLFGVEMGVHFGLGDGGVRE